MKGINKYFGRIGMITPEEVSMILQKHPNKIPVYITKSYSSNNIPAIRRNKFLIPRNFLVAEFIYSIRKWIALPPEQAMFIFVNYFTPSSNETMENLYIRHKQSDGLLHITYAAENTFGYN